MNHFTMRLTAEDEARFAKLLRMMEERRASYKPINMTDAMRKLLTAVDDPDCINRILRDTADGNGRDPDAPQTSSAVPGMKDEYRAG